MKITVTETSYRVVARRPHMRDSTSDVILCYLPGNTVTPWATWRQGRLDGGRYWGHYFKNESDARADYASR